MYLLLQNLQLISECTYIVAGQGNDAGAACAPDVVDHVQVGSDRGQGTAVG